MSSENSGNSIDGTINAVTGLVEKVPIYQDAVQPLARQTGKALETVGRTVNAALMPLRGVVWGMEQLEDFVHTKLSSKLQNIPVENIVTPSPRIAGPTLEALKFSGSEEALREMYANLLANAMDSETQNLVHPSFVQIINQLLPSEAKLLSQLCELSDYPLVTKFYERHTIEGGWSSGSDIKSNQIKAKFIKEHGGVIPDLDIGTAFDNLLRLQLLEIESQTSHSLEDSFSTMFEDKLSGQLEMTIIQHDDIKFTSLGEKFIESCVNNKT